MRHGHVLQRRADGRMIAFLGGPKIQITAIGLALGQLCIGHLLQIIQHVCQRRLGILGEHLLDMRRGRRDKRKFTVDDEAT